MNNLTSLHNITIPMIRNIHRVSKYKVTPKLIRGFNRQINTRWLEHQRANKLGIKINHGMVTKRMLRHMGEHRKIIEQRTKENGIVFGLRMAK